MQRLYFALANHLRLRPNQGEVVLAPFDVVLSFHDVVEPDLLLIAGDQEQILTPQNVKGAPALVVEVLSPGTMGRDEGIKRQLFERVGVREDRIVDSDRNRIRVFRRAPDDSFPLVGDLAAEPPHRLRTPLLPGFSLRLDQLFRQGR